MPKRKKTGQKKKRKANGQMAEEGKFLTDPQLDAEEIDLDDPVARQEWEGVGRAVQNIARPETKRKPPEKVDPVEAFHEIKPNLGFDTAPEDAEFEPKK